MAAVLAPIIIMWVVWEGAVKNSRPGRIILTCLVIANFLAGSWLAYLDGVIPHAGPPALLATLVLLRWRTPLHKRED